MKDKIRAVGKLQQVEEKRRDRIGQQLDTMRQRHQHMQNQLDQLAQLKSGNGESTRQVSALNSTVLMNLSRVDHMLQKLLVHHEQEQAVMEAQCHSVQKELASRHARVKGIEQVLDRWRRKQDYDKARKEQKHIEDILNARYRKREL
ncbi:flagellar export protein FliJ [Vibrio sp. CDRSL-10 TSBA]